VWGNFLTFFTFEDREKEIQIRCPGSTVETRACLTSPAIRTQRTLSQVDDGEVALIDEKNYRWPNLDILNFLMHNLTEERSQIGLLLLSTAEQEEPYIEHTKLQGRKRIKVRERYMGWRAGKMIWQQFW